ncbi:MAG TPA: molecular chaperone [Nevskiaceae bacterium]
MRLRILGAAVAAILCGSAAAASLQVAPISLSFPAGAAAQPLWLTNSGTGTLNAQVRIFHWTQENNEDVLSPTDRIVASPPIIAIAPDARQLIRVVRIGDAAPVAEESYRVLVDELPDPEPSTTSGVNYVFRYSIPVFVEPAGPAASAGQIASALHFSLAHTGGNVELVAENAGATHAQLSAVNLLVPGHAPVVVSAGLLGYVLPGRTRRWPLPAEAARLPATATLQAHVNGEPIHQALVLGGVAR